MGYESGVVLGRGSGITYGTDSYRIGRCNVGDEFPFCKGGCNDQIVGGSCFNGASCEKDEPVKISLQCSGGNSPKTSTCSGKI